MFKCCYEYDSQGGRGVAGGGGRGADGAAKSTA